MHEPGPWGQLVRQVEARDIGADDAVRRRRLRLGQAAHRTIQQPVVGEFPVRRGAPVASGDGAVPHGQRGRKHPPAAGRDVQVDRSGLRGDHPQRGTGMLNRQTPGGVPLVGTESCRRRDHTHACDVDVELLGDDLGKRGEHTLPEFHLARPDVHDPGSTGCSANPPAGDWPAGTAVRSPVDRPLGAQFGGGGETPPARSGCGLRTGTVAVERGTHLGLGGIVVVGEKPGCGDHDARMQ